MVASSGTTSEELAVAVLADPDQQGEPRWASTGPHPFRRYERPLAERRPPGGTYAPPARSDPAGPGNLPNPAVRLDGAAGPDPGPPTPERAPLLLGQTAPHPMLGPRIQSPAEARATTGQPRQTALAASTCKAAGPLVPTGKNSSGSPPRQAAF
jgi:hypothetical protein